MMYSCTELRRNKQEYVGVSRTGVHVRSFAIHLLSAGGTGYRRPPHARKRLRTKHFPLCPTPRSKPVFSLSARYPEEICLRNELLD